MACALALRHFLTHPHSYDHLYIFTDSTYSIGCLSKGWAAKSNRPLIRAVKNIITHLNSIGLLVHIDWIPAHVGIDMNEHADFLAGEGSKRSAQGRPNINLNTLLNNGCNDFISFIPDGQ